MNNVLPHYQRPIHTINDQAISIEYWDKANDAFDNKKYKQTIINVINYINPKALNGIDLEGNISITKMQGSAEINISITDSHFKVTAPFLRMVDQTNKIALQRKIAEVNFNPLTLIQIHQHEQEFWFDYETDVSLCNPYKIYDILREICVYADDYDDIFIDKYKAEFYKEPKITALSVEDSEKAWNQIEKVFEDYKNYTAFFKEKRWDDYNWDIIAISLLKISNMPYVNGKLRSDIIENISYLYNGNIDFRHRVDKGINYMNSLVGSTKEEILKNIYHAEQFQSIRMRSSEKIISEVLDYSEERVEKHLNNENYFTLSYYLQFTFLKLIYDYNLEQNYKNAIYNALESAAGKSPEVGYKILVDTYYNLLNAEVSTTKKSESKKGFFASLFS